MTDTAETKNGPDVIYLESEADKYGSEGRLWCEDDDPSGSGYPWIRYVRHDLVTAKDAEIAALKEKVKRQAEALKPWANLAEQFGFPYNDNDPVLITNGVNYVKHAFTVGDLRRAAQEAGHE